MIDRGDQWRCEEQHSEVEDRPYEPDRPKRVHEPPLVAARVADQKGHRAYIRHHLDHEQDGQKNAENTVRSGTQQPR